MFEILFPHLLILHFSVCIPTHKYAHAIFFGLSLYVVWPAKPIAKVVSFHACHFSAAAEHGDHFVAEA